MFENTQRTAYNALFYKPKTEQELFNLQMLYRITKDQKVWDLFFEIVTIYATSLIKKKNTGKIFLEPQIVTDKAYEASIELMELYKIRKDFNIYASFAGMLSLKVSSALHFYKEDESNLSFNTFLGDESKDLETVKAKEFNLFLNEHPTITKDTLITAYVFYIKFIDSLKKEYLKNKSIKYFKLAFVGRCYFLNKLNKESKNIAENLFTTFKLTNKEKTVFRTILASKNKILEDL